MAISVDWVARLIFVPKSDLSPTADPLIFELDTDIFRLELTELLAEPLEGLIYPDTHLNTKGVVLGGDTYGPTLEIISNYTVTFEQGNYRVSLVGSNNNIQDVANVNSVSVQSNNSGGLINSSGGGFTSTDRANLQLAADHARAANAQTKKDLP